MAAEAEAKLAVLYDVAERCAFDRMDKLRREDIDECAGDETWAGVIDARCSCYSRSVRELQIAKVGMARLSHSVLDVMRRGLDDVFVAEAAPLRLEREMAAAVNANEAVVEQWNADCDAHKNWHVLHAQAVVGQAVQEPGKRYIRSDSSAPSPIVEVVHSSHSLLSSLRKLNVLPTVDLSPGGLQNLSHNLRRGYSGKARSGVDHAANGRFFFHGLTRKYSDSRSRSNSRSRAAHESYFVPRKLDTDEDVRAQRPLLFKLHKGLDSTRRFAEKLHGLFEPQETVVRRVLQGLTLTRKQMTAAAASMPREMKSEISRGKPTSSQTNGTGIVTDGFSTAAEGHLDRGDGKNGTLCHGAVFSSVSGAELEEDSTERFDHGARCASLCRRAPPRISHPHNVRATSLPPFCFPVSSPLLRVGSLANFSAHASEADGSTMLVEVRSPFMTDDGAMFNANVHSSMGFPGLRLASGGLPLNVATLHGAATYWRAAYTLHSTNLPWAQSRGMDKQAWPLRLPLLATWDYAPLRDRAVVLQWGAYSRPASHTAARAARWRARAALR